MSKDSFKNFVKQNPQIISYVKNNDTSWQKLYEVYDMYGEDKEIWNTYLKQETKDIKSNAFNELVNMAKNIDIDKMQSGVTSLQKALGLFSELFITKNSNVSSYQPRAVYKRFED